MALLTIYLGFLLLTSELCNAVFYSNKNDTDRPDAPTDVRVHSCKIDMATISFKPGKNNSNRLSEFIIYFNATVDGRQEYLECERRRAGQSDDPTQTIEITISSCIRPWRTLFFYVTAVNSIGESDQSLPSETACITNQTKPTTNPANVCCRLGDPMQLIIVWDPVSFIEQNGEGFHYKVNYRPLNWDYRPLNSEPFETKEVTNPQQGELVIHQQDKFIKYEIYVQSANNVGTLERKPGERKFAHSSEETPLEIAKNFSVRDDSINSTSAIFAWNSVDTSEERIRGFFNGYRIQFWRVSKPNEVRTQDIILGGPVNLCPASVEIEPKRRKRRPSRYVNGAVTKLWSNSKIAAGVVVLNKKNAGPISNVIEFETPVGVPDCKDFIPPMYADVTRSGNIATVQCIHSQDSWEVKCVEGNWIELSQANNTKANCTGPTSAIMHDHNEPVQDNNVVVVVVPAVLAVAVVIGISIGVGIFCVRRTRQYDNLICDTSQQLINKQLTGSIEAGSKAELVPYLNQDVPKCLKLDSECMYTDVRS